jgi:competence protein ComEC
MLLDGRDGVRSPDGDRFAAVARARHVRLVAPATGQRLRVGPAELDVLSPAPEPAALHTGEDPNQRAIVAELRDGGFSMLLTADTESDVLGGLPLEPVDVLKVAHHGSAESGLAALLQRLRPAVALIEVGARNPYGHPAPTTVSELQVVPRVLRTDRDGTVRLHVGPGPPARIAIQTHA